MAFPSTARDTTYLHRRGSAYAAFQEVQSTGAPLGTPDTLHNIGFIQTGTYQRTATTESETDAGGTTHNTGTTTEATLNLKIMQRDVVHLKAPKTFTGYARMYQELTQKKLGASADKGQIAVLAACQFVPSFGWNLEDMFPEWEMTVSSNSTGSALTVDLTAFTGSLGAGVGNASIGAGEYEDIVEFSYA